MPRPLTFQQIEAFRAVVLLGTTVAAANMLNTTQPTISRLIGQTQNATGLKLFINDRGRLQLTREGRHLFETIQINFQGMARIEQVIATLREAGTGVLRIASTPSLACSILPIAMTQFSKRFPHVKFNIQTLGSHEIEERLRHGFYDIALVHRLFEGSEFKVEQIHQADAVCISSQSHPFVGLKSVTVSDLVGQTMISLPYDDDMSLMLRKEFVKLGVNIPTSIETIYSSTICTLVSKNLGIAVINPYISSLFKENLSVYKFVPRIPVKVYVANARFLSVSEMAPHFCQALKDACVTWQ